MKRCPRCGETKPLSDFYKNRSQPDGHNGYCKPCWTSKVYEWRSENPEKWESSRSKINRRGPNNNRWRRGRTQQVRAHNVVAWAVKTGKLVRPEACDKCHESGRIEAHHEDYLQPLMVEWLCSPCHRQAHPKVRI